MLGDADGAFDLAFSSNAYSHIETAAARAEFVADALRASRELVVREQALRLGRDRELWELRRLVDGSEHRVFKRYPRSLLLVGAPPQRTNASTDLAKDHVCRYFA